MAKKTAKKKAAKKVAKKKTQSRKKKKTSKKAAAPSTPLKKGELLSTSAVAHRKGVAVKTVHKAIVDGKLECALRIVDKDGKVSARGVTAAACRAWTPAWPADHRKKLSDSQKAAAKKRSKATRKKVAKKKASKRPGSGKPTKADLQREAKRRRDKAYRQRKRAAAAAAAAKGA